MAEKSALQATSPYYPHYCCTNHSVWRNTETNKLSVVIDSFSPGMKFIQVPGGAMLCCEDAFALAGLPPICGLPSGTGGLPPTTGGHQPAVCDWNVYKSMVTGKFRLVSGMQNIPGSEFEPVMNGQNLCCADAAALAGFPPSFCTGSGGSGIVPAPSTALTGTRLNFHPTSSAGQCQSDCANNAKCKAFTFIQAGTYAGAAAMCYLMSDVTGSSPARGYTSGMRDGSQIPGGPVAPQPPLPPGTTGTAKPSGPLTAKVEVKPGHKDGFSNFSYGPLSANLDYANNQAQQIHVSITFGGVPQSLTPGQEFTVTVGVSVTSQPAAIAANWAVNGSVEAAGLEVVSAQSAGAKRPGNYVFRVPLNAASATITLHGDFGIGDAAVYTYTRK
jgi:hypothetical protein